MTRLIGLIVLALSLSTCMKADTKVLSAPDAWVDLSATPKPAAVTQTPWQEVVIGVPDFNDLPRLFTEIGAFETVSRDSSDWVLRAPGATAGHIRFQITHEAAVPTRPFGSRPWDTGCYFSVMMRANDISSIIEDAKTLGWDPLTEMAYLKFGPSELNIVVLGHRKTGIQVQLYERLTTPLPEGFTPFERLSRPFNVMQMVADRDAAYTFYRQSLGFDSFYFGKPTVSQNPEISPIGIPTNLTTTVPYSAGIVTPKAGLEWGRMEMIEVGMDGGQNLSAQCQHGNIGITEVRFALNDLDTARRTFAQRGVNIVAEHTVLRVKTPDGANISFYKPGIVQ